MRDTIIHATFLKDVGDPGILNRYQVEVKRFDELFPELARPAVGKIDVEGAEMMVLKSMGAAINSLDAIVIETSFTSSYEGGRERSGSVHVGERLCVLRLWRRQPTPL